MAPAVLQKLSRCILAAGVFYFVLGLVGRGNAYTRPDQYQKLVAFRDEQRARGYDWQQALATWTCPTPPANSDQPCDPCGKYWEGNWFHMHCRGPSKGSSESSEGIVDGYVTNIHITDVDLSGSLPKALCMFGAHLREFDMDGGHLTGPLPAWLPACFPIVSELDLSFNRLTGTLPLFIANMTALQEFQVGMNNFVGTIPEAYGYLPKIRSYELAYNRFYGKIPESFKNLQDTLTNFEIAGNDFEGDLHSVAGAKLMTVSVHDNPRLCGMVPASVRYAKGFSNSNTQLGKPCSG